MTTRPVRRIHITGGPGAGKTTLARRLASITGLPVVHLDEVARVGGGTGRVRSAAERERLLTAMTASDQWITEGVHLGWTEPLMTQADLIVWLDVGRGSARANRIVGRFARDAWGTFRDRSWRERLTALPGYARRIRDLVGAMVDARRYDRRPTEGPRVPQAAADPGQTLGSRAATELALAPWTDRVVRCSCDAEVEALVRRVADTATATATPTVATTAGVRAAGVPGT